MPASCVNPYINDTDFGLKPEGCVNQLATIGYNANNRVTPLQKDF